jgi:ketosteroid isomerase-like protein
METEETVMTVSRLARISILCIWIAAISAGHISAQGAKTDADEIARRETIKVDAAFNKAITEKDGAALERILADDLSWVARGDRLNKAQVIADVKSENLHFKSLSHEDLQIKIFGNTAVVTGHSTSVLEYKGKLWSTPRLFTSVYMKLGDRWQMVAHQVSNEVEK